MLFLFDNLLNPVGYINSADILDGFETFEINTATLLNVTVIAKKETMNILENARYAAVKDDLDKNRANIYRLAPYTLQGEYIELTGIEKFYDDMEYNEYIKDYRPNSQTPETIFNTLLSGSGYQLDYVHPDLSKRVISTNFYYISRLESISKAVEMFNIEIESYIAISDSGSITGQFLNLTTRLGKDLNTRYVYGRNTSDVISEQDPLNVVTSVLGRGKGEENDEGNYGRRIMFGNVEWSTANGDPLNKPLGEVVLTDPSAMLSNSLADGKPRLKIITFEDCETPEELIQLSYEWLMQNNRPKVQFKASPIEFDAQTSLGDTVTVVRTDMGIKYQTRIFKFKRHLFAPNMSIVEFGEKLDKSMSDIQKDFANSISKDWNNKLEESLGSIIVNSDGNKISYGELEPGVKKVGDMWYEKYTSGGKVKYRLKIWNGTAWEVAIDESLAETIKNQVDSAVNSSKQALENANNAIAKAEESISKMGTVMTDIDDINNILYDTEVTSTLAGVKSIEIKVESSSYIRFARFVLATSMVDENYLARGNVQFVKRMSYTQEELLDQNVEKYMSNAHLIYTFDEPLKIKRLFFAVDGRYDSIPSLYLKITYDDGSVVGGEKDPNIPILNVPVNDSYMLPIKYQEIVTPVIPNLTSRLSDAEGNISAVQQTASKLQTAVTNVEGDMTTLTQTVHGFDQRVTDAEGNASQAIQTVDVIQTSVKNLEINTNSKLTQMSDNINLKVSKGDVINQINVSPESILISGQKVHITGQTIIDNGVIKDAMITNLSASKLTAGTIDASKINVINLNAANITGNISQFVQTAWNGINSSVKISSNGLELYRYKGTKLVHFDTESMRFYDDNGGLVATIDPETVVLSGGVDTIYPSALTFELNKTEGAIRFNNSKGDTTMLYYDGSQSAFAYKGWTVRNTSFIFENTQVYLGTLGVTSTGIIGEGSPVTGDVNRYWNTNEGYITVRNKRYDGVALEHGKKKFMAETYGVILANGAVGFIGKGIYNFALETTSGGNNIITSDAILNRTYSSVGSASQVVITSNGIMGAVTSSKRFKLCIEESDPTQFKKILDIQPKTWFDKRESEEKADYLTRLANGEDVSADINPIVERTTGAIAEDFEDAGLSEFVIYDSDTGEVNGLQYERAWLYLIPLVRELYERVEVLENK